MTTSKSTNLKKAPYHHGKLRQALIDQAVQTISHEGVEALSLRKLARALGVSHAAPSRHFQSKADLLSAIAAHGYRELTETTMAAATKSNAPMEQLEAMLRTYVHWATQNPKLYSTMRNPDVIRYDSSELSDLLSNFVKHQFAAVQRAQATGWNPKVAPDVLMMKLAATAAGTAMVLCDPMYRRTVQPSSSTLLVDQMIQSALGH